DRRLRDRGVDVEQAAVVEVGLAAVVDASEKLDGDRGIEPGPSARLDRRLLERGEVHQHVLVSAGDPQTLALDGAPGGLDHANCGSRTVLVGHRPSGLRSRPLWPSCPPRGAVIASRAGSTMSAATAIDGTRAGPASALRCPRLPAAAARGPG